MSLLYCEKCGEPWKTHENCEDDENAKTLLPSVPSFRRCPFTRGIIFAAAEVARHFRTNHIAVQILMAAAGGARAVREHGDEEDIEALRSVLAPS